MFEKMKINEKEASVGPFFKKGNNFIGTIPWYWGLVELFRLKYRVRPLEPSAITPYLSDWSQSLERRCLKLSSSVNIFSFLTKNFDTTFAKSTLVVVGQFQKFKFPKNCFRMQKKLSAFAGAESYRKSRKSSQKFGSTDAGKW